MPTYQTRNLLARTSPLRSVPLFRPVSAIPGLVKWTALDQANWDLSIALRDLPGCEKSYAYTREVLGNVNRRRGPAGMRRLWRGQAFRHLNAARAALRRVRKALAAAQLAVLLAAPTTVAA